jgi:hypothetical protein
LAHLKRRDHWICWGDLVIGCLYWWHPIAWWVRWKIRDEADFCCDAWVTALMPTGRSAYARALLTTRQFVSQSSSALRNQAAVPVVGLGACTPKTKKFARRLTMVMTQRSKPSMSFLGAAVAACLAMAGWLAAPILACPPEESEARHKAALKAELKAKEKAKAEAVTVAPMRKRSAEAERELSTYEAHRAERDQQPRPHADDLRGRIDQLEHRLDRISEQLERLIEGPRSMAPQGQGNPAFRSAIAAPAAPGQVRVQRAPIAGMAFAAPPAAPSLPEIAAPLAEVRGRLLSAEAAAVAALEDGGEVEIRLYRLPAGKRDDFYKFMARQDVPVLVSQAPEGVNVHATPRQHESVKAFIDLIHPEGRQHQPVPAGGGAHGGPRIAPTELDRLNKLAREYEVAAAQASQGNARRAHELAQAMKSRQHEMWQHLNMLHQRSDELRRKAFELQRQSDELESKAEALDDEAQRHHILTQAEAIRTQAEAIEAQAEAEAEQADAVEEQVEAALEEMEEAATEAADEAENADSEESD